MSWSVGARHELVSGGPYAKLAESAVLSLSLAAHPKLRASLLDAVKGQSYTLKYPFRNGVRHYHNDYAQSRSQWGAGGPSFVLLLSLSMGAQMQNPWYQRSPYAELVKSAGAHMQNPWCQWEPFCRTCRVSRGPYIEPTESAGAILS